MTAHIPRIFQDEYHIHQFRINTVSVIGQQKLSLGNLSNKKEFIKKTKKRRLNTYG